MDLSAQRVGDHVLLRWTTPSRTTDDMEIKDPKTGSGAATMTAELCRETGPRPAAPADRLAACAPVLRLPVVPGPSEATDTLPPALREGPPALLAYRIEISNSGGRSAGESPSPAFAAAGHAPPPVAALQASASQQGAVLEWRSDGAPKTEKRQDTQRELGPADLIDFTRVDLTLRPSPRMNSRPSPRPPSGKNKPVQPAKSSDGPANEVHLRAPDAAVDPNTGIAGTVDTTAAMGDTYTYVAQRIQTVKIGGHLLEIGSPPSSAVTLAMRDTFPPRPPAGLATISGNAPPDSTGPPAPYPSGLYVDLSWEPNSEPDLAGYRVYRQLARPDGSPQGPLARLTTLPISVPAYRDVAVKAGQGYIYSVTAVDAAGNESAPSAKALEIVPAQE